MTGHLDWLHPSEFVFSQELPLGSWHYPAIAVVVYLPLVLLTWLYARSQPKMDLKGLTMAHNLFLCLWSLAMFLGIAIGAAEVVFTDSTYALLCVPAGTGVIQGVLGYWLYIYYLSKYYELFDTFLAIVKHKPLTFLHVYHHAVIPLLCWAWLAGQWPLQWFAAIMNTLIHVFMYYYYFVRTAYGYEPWWKRYLTQAQITQFFSGDLMFLIFCYETFRGATNVDWSGWTTLSFWEQEGGCTGNFAVLAFTFFVNTSFLVLFINFFVKSYGPRKPPMKKE